MKTKIQSLFVGLALLAGIHPTFAQQPIVITSFSQNGVLTCTNLSPGSTATIQWASSVNGTWSDLFDMTVASNRTIVASVPMFYRVLGIAASTNNAPADMSLIPAGSFTMGDTLDGDGLAFPTNIYVSAFRMDVNLVSYSLWETVYAYATSRGYQFDYGGDGKAMDHPVQTVAWYDVVKWCNARSEKAGLQPVYYTDAGQVYKYGNLDLTVINVHWAANGYRLPTEAEWEKAARGGLSGKRFPWGNTINESQANYSSSPSLYYDVNTYSGYNTNFDSGDYPYTSPVGYFAPNGYGLNDMAGNVYVWCWDWYSVPYGQPTASDPTGPSSGGGRVIRGGAYFSYAYDARCASRGYDNPNTADDFIGFRCVRRP
jgi:formylglycine-generating enzyme required for sulfatase activity